MTRPTKRKELAHSRSRNIIMGRAWGPQPKEIYQKRMITFGNEALIYEYPDVMYSWTNTKRTDYQKSDKPTDRRSDSVLRSREMIKRIIKCNEKTIPDTKTGKQLPVSQLRFYTFTFANPYRDECRTISGALKYWKIFIRRLRNNLLRNGYPRPAFISVVEYQDKGSDPGVVHFHVLFFNLPFVPVNSTVYDNNNSLFRFHPGFYLLDIWTFGDVKPILLDRVDHVSLYVAKYLTKGTLDKRFYGQKVYFTSRGNLNRPEDTFDESLIDNFMNSDKIQILHERLLLPTNVKITNALIK